MNMTNEEAKLINERAFLVDACGNADEYLIEANKMAISALEKQIPKRRYGNGIPQCPACKKFSIVDSEFGEHYSFCTDCGQAIDWTEVD